MYFKRFDIFGKPITLNYGKLEGKDLEKSDVYRTEVGGLFSIILKILFSLCCIYFSFIMF